MDQMEQMKGWILESLVKVQHPEQQKSIIELKMVDTVAFCDGIARVDLILSSTADPNRDALFQRVKEVVGALEGVQTVNVGISLKTPPVKPAFTKTPSAPAPMASLPNIKNIIAVSSGKGGVGKTSISVNLACALQQEGAKVGILDADIYGPNVPIMMGLRGAKFGHNPEKDMLIPTENHGVKVVSMYFLIKEDQPVVWRGPMLDKVIRQFLTQADWGELDYLIIDLPPGTGDAQLTIIQATPVVGAIIVTTPQDVAIHDSRKGLTMFTDQKIPVLGIIENMSYFVGDDGKRYEIFGHGGGRNAADKLGVPFLGEVPIVPAQREKADEGVPVVVYAPNSEQATIFRNIAHQVIRKVHELAGEPVPTH